MTKEEALEILDWIPTKGEEVDALEMAIKALQEQKVGKWLDDGVHHICSNCGCRGWNGDKFCPNCGARMVTDDE